MPHRLIDYLRQHHRLIISELEAERVLALPTSGFISVQGRDGGTGLPCTLEVSSTEITYATGDPDG